MKSRKIQAKIVLILAGGLLVGLVLVSGCEKESEPAAPPETKEVASAVGEQTTCPVMAGAINKTMFTEYKGKKVYFCCPGCKEKFEKEPEKYIAKLPQFSK